MYTITDYHKKSFALRVENVFFYGICMKRYSRFFLFPRYCFSGNTFPYLRDDHSPSTPPLAYNLGELPISSRSGEN